MSILKNKTMIILNEKNKKDLENFYPNGLFWLKNTLTYLSSSYAIKAGKIALKLGVKNENYLKLTGIADNLKFGSQLIDNQIILRNEWGKEKANFLVKFYELHKQIDAKNQELKLLKKQLHELKKNINE